jgi:hypothetical protein
MAASWMEIQSSLVKPGRRKTGIAEEEDRTSRTPAEDLEAVAARSIKTNTCLILSHKAFAKKSSPSAISQEVMHKLAMWCLKE